MQIVTNEILLHNSNFIIQNVKSKKTMLSVCVPSAIYNLIKHRTFRENLFNNAIYMYNIYSIMYKLSTSVYYVLSNVNYNFFYFVAAVVEK